MWVSRQTLYNTYVACLDQRRLPHDSQRSADLQAASPIVGEEPQRQG